MLRAPLVQLAASLGKEDRAVPAHEHMSQGLHCCSPPPGDPALPCTSSGCCPKGLLQQALAQPSGASAPGAAPAPLGSGSGASCLSAGLLVAGHSALSCIPGPESFSPRLQTHLGRFQSQHCTCPLLDRDLSRLPPPACAHRHLCRGAGTPAAHLAPSTGTAGPPVPLPARSTGRSEKHSSSLCFIEGILQKIKVPTIH